MDHFRLVLDTNVLVSASFNPQSSSAKIIQWIRDEKCEFVWDEATQAETKHVLDQIPKIGWEDFVWLFNPQTQYKGKDREPERVGLGNPDLPILPY